MNKQAEQGKKHKCGVCGRSFPEDQVFPVDGVRPQMAALLDRDTPQWRETGFICKEDLAATRRRYIEDLVRRERGELTHRDKEVVDALVNDEVISDDDGDFAASRASFGEKLADQVANFGGSWTFIIFFALVLALWMGFNISALFAAEQFDPYPFILLNLVLSCLAAIQAPLIMMSQKRQEAKDRQRAENDYQVNLKAELEIRLLHEKMDYLLTHQMRQKSASSPLFMDKTDAVLSSGADQTDKR